MKRLTLLSALLITLQTLMFSQSAGKGKGVFYVGAGTGRGFIGSGVYVRGYGYEVRQLPSLQLGFEYGISEAIPQSIIGLGAHLSTNFSSNSYRDKFGYGWDKTWIDLTIASKGYYHHKFLVKDKWDVYGSALIGVMHRAYRFSSNSPYYEYARGSYSSIYPVIGAGIGARYYVSKSFGFYAEVNSGINADFAQIGFAFKF